MHLPSALTPSPQYSLRHHWVCGSGFAEAYIGSLCMRSPMTRVVKVLWAANRNRWRSAARQRGARARSGYSGPVNLPTSGPLLDGANPGIAAAMARVHSYEWLHNAVEDADEAGAGPGLPEGYRLASSVMATKVSLH